MAIRCRLQTHLPVEVRKGEARADEVGKAAERVCCSAEREIAGGGARGLGALREKNLYLTFGEQWNARYVSALIRRYPFVSRPARIARRRRCASTSRLPASTARAAVAGEHAAPVDAGYDGLAQDIQVLQRIHAFIGRHCSLLVFR